MKKNLFVICLALLSFVSQNVTAETYSGVDGNITWILDAGTGVLTLSGNGPMNDYGSEDNPSPWRCYRDVINTIVVEDGIESIGGFAFYDLGTVSSVTLPQSVKGIGGGAFGACQITEPFSLPQNLQSIGEGAFGGISGNITSLTIPKNVSEIGRVAFRCSDNVNIIVDSENEYFSSDEYCIFDKNKTVLITCYRNGETYAIPETVTSINPYAFWTHCFDKIVLSSSLKTITDATFGNLHVNTISISSDVTEIERGAFRELEIESIEVSADNDYFCSVDGVLYDKDMTRLICYPGRKETPEFSVPSSVTTIDPDAFLESSSCILSSLFIPKSVTNIDELVDRIDFNHITVTFESDNDSFGIDDYCIFNKEMTELIKCYRDGDTYTIPNSVTSIGNSAFTSRHFSVVTIPGTVETIDNIAFYGSGVCSVLIQEGVKTIGGRAFYGSGNLRSIVLPHTLQEIGGEAFKLCNNLETIYIPENVKIIEGAALCGADAIDVDASNPYFSSFDGVIYNKNQTAILCLPYGTEKETFTIPSTVTAIGADAFHGNSQLTSITIPESVRIIENSAFFGCGMETIELPRGLTSIGGRGFFGCKNMKNLTIPKNVAAIDGFQTFWGCDNLEYIVLKGRHTSLNNVVEFFGAEGSHIPTIYVPYGSSEAYKSAADWSEFADYIVEMEKDENDDLTSIYAGDIYLQRGGTAVLPIYMNNDVKVAGFQFNLCLPEGIEVDYTTARTGGVSYSTTVVKGDERFDDDINFSLSCQKQADGSMMVMCYSTDNDEIYDEDIEGNDIRQTAPLLYITLRGSADLELTDYTVMLSDIVISHYDKATGATSVYDLEYSNAKIEVVSTRYLAVVSNDAAKGTVAVEAANYDTETGEIDYGVTATLTATPNEGYHFVRWTENDTELTTENPYSFDVTDDHSIVGEFAINQYRVQFVANGETVYDELLDYMSVITMPEAPAVSGMVFITWGEVDETVPTHNVTYTAEYAKLGDLYEDDRLNVGDITALAGIILNGGTDDARTFAMANVYQDDRLNVGDVTALAGIILNGGVASAPSLRRRAALAPLYSAEYNNDIYAGNICVEPGTKQVVLPVYLANNVSISGFQFQLYLPEGVKVAYTTGRNGISYTSTIVKGEDRFDSDINFTLSNQEQADGSMMIMCYSTVNDAIYDEDLSGNDCRLTSPVLNITLEIEDGFVGSAYKIEMKEKSLSHFDSTTDVFYPDNTQSLLSMQQTIDFSMSAAGWGSLILPFDAAVPEGLAAFSCTGVEEDGDKGWLTLVESKTLSANTPYIMKGEAGMYTFTGYPCNLNDSYDDGLLVGVMKDTEVGEGYVLQNQGGEVAFFQLASAKTIPANRCYLKSTTDITASSLGIREGDTTQIDELLYEDSADAAIYDLSGRKLTVNPEELSEGVYIINGKKTIIK